MQWPIPQWPTRHVYNPRASGGLGMTSLSTSGTAHTKGAWATLVPGGTTTQATSWVYLNARTAANTTDTSTIMDIAVGGAGSETIVLADLLLGFRPSGGLLFPLHIPAGATVRARLASIRTSISSAAYSLDLYGGEPDSGLSAPGKITGYGVIPASSAGTTVTPNATIDVKGSYAQLVAATTAPIHGLLVLVQGSSAALATNNTYNIDIAVGGAGSETIVVADHLVEVNALEEMRAYTHEFIPRSLSIPSGVRLSARCSSTVSSSAAIEVAVYGFTY